MAGPPLGTKNSTVKVEVFILKLMADEKQEEILQALVNQSLLPASRAETVRSELQKTPGSLRDFLVGREMIDEEQFAQIQAQAVGLPYVNLNEITIPKDVLGIIPESTARGHLIIAYEQTRESLKVAMADPSDRQIVEFVHKKVDLPVEVALASVSGIRDALGQYQESLDVELQNLIKQTETVLDEEDLNKIAEDLPIIKITDTILKHAILQGASDIHLEPSEQQVVVRYRIDGILHDVMVFPKKVMAGLVARIKILARLKIDEHRLPQDGRFKIQTDDYRVSFRVSALPVFDGEKIVMRLLDETGQGLALEDVGMSERTLEIFRRNIHKPNGMVLVTGPTGSGKTTTLYAGMRELNIPEVNISTVEDPIEYRIERVNQTQVMPQIGLTFSNGLRSLVRQDPDIIMVGEIRDEETASLAVNAALTGHMVLSTLHTNSAAGAFPRLLDMGVEAFLVVSTVNLLLAQRLVRRLCDKCRTEVPVDQTMLDSLKGVADPDFVLTVLRREGVIDQKVEWKQIKVYRANGCKRCHDGYKGRIGIYEVLEMTPKIQAIVTPKTNSQQLEQAAREQQNMVTMVEDGVMKVVQGVTTIEEVLRVAKE